MIMNVNITDYTTIPAGRYISEGEYSGEDCRNKLLSGMFKEAREKGVKMLINIDGLSGYPSSFFNEAIGGLAREYGIPYDSLWNTIELISVEPSLINEVKGYTHPSRDRNNILKINS